MNFTEKLNLLTAQSQSQIEKSKKVQAMLAGSLAQQDYVKFLVVLYPIVSNFCPVMALAAGHAADKNQQIVNYLYDHIYEEKGHEQLVLNDLKSFEVDVTPIAELPAVPPVQAMLAFNYYSASYVHPVCVFGMMYVLEIMASVYGGRAARSLAAYLNRNSMEGFSFLDSHADLDQDHVIKLRNLFQSFTDESSQAALLNSIKMNFYLFEKIMDY
jgi:pyrroloquinoline quinone (PQQ) biosynthesis protein C